MPYFIRFLSRLFERGLTFVWYGPQLRCVLLFSLLLLVSICVSQNNSRSVNIEVQHWNVEEGLSHRDINTIFQDSKGFVWIGTRNGLNRFDGHSFRIYTDETDDIGGNDIQHLVEDAEGWIWVTSGSEPLYQLELSFIHVQTREVVDVKTRFAEQFPIAPENIRNVIPGEPGEILFTGENQLFRYRNGQFEQLYTFDLDPVIDGYHPELKTMICHKRTVENGKKSEVVELQETKLKGRHVFDTEPFMAVNSFYDTKGNAWLRVYDRYYQRGIHSTDWKLVELPDFVGDPTIISSQYMGMYPLKSNRLLYFDQKHLIVFEPGGAFQVDVGKQVPAIYRANIRTVLHDARDNIWLGTQFGLYQIRLRESPFTNFLNQSLETYDVNSCFSSLGVGLMEGKLWANGRNGDQFLIDPTRKTVTPLEFDGAVMPLGPAPTIEMVVFYPIGQPEPNVHLTVDLNVLEFRDGAQYRAYHWKTGHGMDKSWSITRDEGITWLGLYEGGLGWIRKDSVERYERYNAFETLRTSQTFQFLKWGKQFLLATNSGIYVLDPTEGIVDRLWQGGGNGKQLPYDNIFHIHRDKTQENLLWAATAGGGLLKITLDTNQLSVIEVEQFTRRDGLANNTLYAVYPDDYDNLWLPSDYGLMKFHIPSSTVTGYTTTDGLPFNEFNRIAHHQTKDGRLIFGTMNGITTFYPGDLLGAGEDDEIPLRILDYKQQDGETGQLLDLTRELLTDSNIFLPPDSRFLTMRFALLEYADPSRIEYSYQVEGQSEAWITLNGNELRLSGLPYGELMLNIRAQGTDGRFSSQQLTIPIRVQRPVYMRWWFLLLCLAGFVAGTYSIFRFRTQRLRKRQRELELEVSRRTQEIEEDKRVIETQAEELKNLDQLKSRFFANVSHELRTPLTLILAPVQEMLGQRKLDDKLRNNLTLVDKNSRRLQGMVNDILDLSKFESGKMTVETTATNWFSYLKQLYASFDSYAATNAIEYNLTYEGDQDLVVALDRAKLETMFNNLLSNAFKFTPKQGQITVAAGADQQQLWFQVHDTGSGISEADLPHVFERYFQTKDKDRAAQGGTGIGLALTQELVKLLEGEITVSSEPGKFTEFKVQIPVDSAVITDSPSIPLTEEPQVDNQDSEVPSLEPEIVPSAETVLLVEDDPDLSQFIRSVLEEYYAVITAFNGQEALQRLEEHDSIRLVISDVMMPVMDGFQLLETLKSNPATRKLPVIMLTARAALEDKLHALRIGVDDYLTKPFVKEELLARMSNLLQNAQGRAEAQLLAAEESPGQVASETDDEETKQWLDKLEAVVLKNIELSEFSIDDLAAELFTSKRQLYRTIKEHIGVTPLQYVKDYKLNYARQLLESKQVNAVKVAALSIGYPNVIYFRREFKKAFGRLPSDYLV